MKRALFVLTTTLVVVACSSSDGTTASDAGAPSIDLTKPTTPTPEAGTSEPVSDAGTHAEASTDSDAAGDNTTAEYLTKVVSFTPGACAGFGADQMPDIVLGPPKGAGDSKGSFDVVSLGTGGTIIVSLEPNAIVDRPGIDFIVYENAFYPGGNPANAPYAEPGEVSVSDDGVTWTAFPCTATAPPWGACAGWHPVEPAATTACDPANGGDPYDLADIGVAQARFIRIVDKTQNQPCSPDTGPNTNGFDLDAIGAIHSKAVE